LKSIKKYRLVKGLSEKKLKKTKKTMKTMTFPQKLQGGRPTITVLVMNIFFIQACMAFLKIELLKV